VLREVRRELQTAAGFKKPDAGLGAFQDIIWLYPSRADSPFLFFSFLHYIYGKKNRKKMLESGSIE